MHVSELDERERETFDRAMDTVRAMHHDEQLAIIERAVTTSIRYATTHKDQILTDWAHGLLATLRLNASKSFKAAVAGHRPPALPQAGINARSLLAAIRR